MYLLSDGCAGRSCLYTHTCCVRRAVPQIPTKTLALSAAADTTQPAFGDGACAISSRLLLSEEHPSHACARSAALQDTWERCSHGTGTGFSSLTGLWIPDKPPPPPPKEPKQAIRGGSSHGGKGVHKTHISAPGKGNRPPSRAATSKRSSREGQQGEGSGPPPVRTNPQTPCIGVACRPQPSSFAVPNGVCSPHQEIHRV